MRGDLGVPDEIVPPDSKDPSPTFRVKGFDGFRVTGERDPRFGCIHTTERTRVW